MILWRCSGNATIRPLVIQYESAVAVFELNANVLELVLWVWTDDRVGRWNLTVFVALGIPIGARAIGVHALYVAETRFGFEAAEHLVE